MAEKKQSPEELQQQILEVELETKRLLLDEAKDRNSIHADAKRRRSEGNKQRMAELEQLRKSHEATVKACRHKSGGNPSGILRGGGIGSFSIITRAIMPDGVTVLLQCSRCRMLLYTPHPSGKIQKKGQSDAAFAAQLKKYKEEFEEFNRLLEESQDNGLQHAELRGPTFFFQNAEGVPVVPERK